MMKLSQLAENRIKELQDKNQQEQKKSTDSDNKLKEAREATRQLRQQELQKKIEYFLNISSLPVRWEEYTFENSEILFREEDVVKKKLEYYCEHFKEAKDRGLGLYLCGEIGTGKSFYSLCVFNELLKNNYKVYRTTLNGIYQKIKSTFSNFNNLTEEQVFKDLLEADLIILDDLGKENISETWGKDIFSLLSTNLNKEEIADFMDTQGNDALLDRFRERLDTLEFVWDSRRKEIGKKLFREFWNER